MFRTPAKPTRENHGRTMTLSEAEELGLASPPGELAGASGSPLHTSSPRSSPGPRRTERPPGPRPECPTGPGPARRQSLDAASMPSARAETHDRISEARSLLVLAKEQLKLSRNTSREIVKKVVLAVERMYQLVEESDTAARQPQAPNTNKPTGSRNTETAQTVQTDKILDEQIRQHKTLVEKIDDQTKLITENKIQIEKLSQLVLTKHTDKQTDIQTDRPTYASVTATPLCGTMHSLIIGSRDKNETGEEVFDKIRRVLNAKEEGTKIDRIRRARDRKIIVGCRDREDIKKVKEKMVEKNQNFTVMEMTNKNPLLKLYGVLKSNSDEDIVKALKNQNAHLYRNCKVEEAQIEIYYRARARNPLTSNVVVKVPPTVWQAATAAGVVHIDMQRVRVTDQSPLIQCSRCLGYGHGKKFCQDPVDVCSHCGGTHLRAGCPVWLADGPASCVNCAKAKIEKTEHNAFSGECPVRVKWDALARSTVAYC